MNKETFKDTLNKHNLSVNDFLDLRNEWDALGFSDRKDLIVEEHSTKIELALKGEQKKKRRIIMNKKYLVYGDTWFEGYGAKITVFGVFDTLEQAKEAKKEKEEEYFKEELKNPYSCIESEDDKMMIEFNIHEIEVNELIDLELGGYCE